MRDLANRPAVQLAERWIQIVGIAIKVDILVYDKQPEAIRTWRRHAETLGLTMEYEELWRGAEQLPQCPIIVLDRTILGASFVAESRQAAMIRPHQLIIASGGELSVTEVVEVMQAGVGYVFSKPFDDKEITSKLPGFVKVVGAKQAEKREYERLRCLFDSLTQKECDVLDNVLRGVSNKVTAEQLRVSVRTIEARRAKVYSKTQSECVAELVRKVDRLSSLRQTYERTTPKSLALAAGRPTQGIGKPEDSRNPQQQLQRPKRYTEEAQLHARAPQPNFATTLQLATRSPLSESSMMDTQASAQGSGAAMRWEGPGIN